MITTAYLYVLILLTIGTRLYLADSTCYPPGPVLKLSSTYQNKQILLYWLPPNTESLKYKVTVTDPSTGIKYVNPNTITEHRKKVSTIVLTKNSVPCKIYVVTVEASSSCGTGLPTDLDVFVYPSTDAPTDILLDERPGTTAIEVTFIVPTQQSSGECTLRFELWYAEKSGGRYIYFERKDIYDPVKLPILLTYLKPSTDYKVYMNTVAYVGYTEYIKKTNPNEIETDVGEVPNKVENLSYTNSEGQVTITWNKPSLDEFNPVVEYKIVAYCQKESITIKETKYTFTQEKGTICKYTVTGINLRGEGPSESITVTLKGNVCTPPGPVSKLTAVYQRTYVKLVWKQPDNFEDLKNLGYTVSIIDKKTEVSIKYNFEIICNGKFCETPINALLTPCRKYLATVYASTDCGTGISMSTGFNAFPATNAPTNLLLNAKENSTAVELEFTKPNKLSQGECIIKYEVVYHIKKNRKMFVKELPNDVQSTLMTYLKSQTTYVFRVDAIAYLDKIKNKNSSESNEIETNRGTAPGAVTNLTESHFSIIVGIKWEVPEHDELNPTLRYSVDKCGTVSYHINTVYSTTQDPGTSCEYKIRAINNVGEGPEKAIIVTTDAETNNL